MPQLTENEYNYILDRFDLESNSFEVLIETGTNYGQTLQNLKYKFKDIHSIELSTNLYEMCKDIFKNDKHINLYHGDSSIELSKIIQNINLKTVFWLDGHYSGGDTARGTKDCPLVEELQSIKENFKNECLIIIDDFRLFGTKINEDWSGITENNLKEILNDRIKNNLQIGDRLIFLLSKIDESI
jgi:hypothetical protein